MKILIGILSCNNKDYLHPLYEGCLKTWNSINTDKVQTVCYFGDSEKNIQDGIFLRLSSPDSYAGVSLKTIDFFKFALQNFEFDYLFRTNISSYVNKKNLYQWLSDKPRNNFYSGVIGNYMGRINFASGSGFTLSKDLVVDLCKNSHKLNYGLIDDVMIGEYMMNKISIYPAPRIDFTHPSQVISFDLNNFHFRCKCEYNRKMDSEVMRAIHLNYT
jgi:hypothetical protein